MEKLTTKRLLAYKNALMKRMPRFLKKEWNFGETTLEREYSEYYFEWLETYKNLKEILATRQHIERN